MTANGIDVSYAQGIIDWDSVKASGVQFAILRCGYGQDEPGQDDETFARNVSECERVGMPYGVYFYAYAYNADRARGEAAHCLRLLAQCGGLSYPVYYDLEDPQIAGLSAGTYGDIVEAFCGTLRDAGYETGTYASLYWYESKLYDSRIDAFEKWVADWSSSDDYEQPHGMWQYTSDGTVPGISGRVDRNCCYVDYPQRHQTPKIRYEAHCADIGWQGVRADGQIAGTTGEGRRLEAVRIELPGIRYRAHVQGIGWMDWVESGGIAGTTGQSRRLEALEIKSPLILSVREHVADIGWLPETHASQTVMLGTVGRAKQMEAFTLRADTEV